jgi:hypothetical protein
MSYNQEPDNIDIFDELRFSHQRNRRLEAELARMKALTVELADALFVQRGSTFEDALIQRAREACEYDLAS